MLRQSLLKWAVLTSIAIASVTFLPGLFHHAAARAALNKSDVGNTGSLQALDKNGKPSGQCPLKHTDVKAEISGFLSRVTVTQEFANPFPDKIEAVYTFPLPQSAAVDDMTMLIGERTVKGKIMRREEAQAAYAAAKQAGQIASLLDQERPNIFTQAVANILPGQEIRITISYVETLKYSDGSYEWSFPMVVGERYIPAGVPDSSRISPPVASGMRAGHDISLEIQLNAGVPLEALDSKTHETEIERTGASNAIVRLKDRNTIPNKDFVLHYQVAGDTINDALLAHRTDRGGFFTLILQPPQRVTAEDVMPKELVFVLDTSGSMEGFPFEKARETMLLALNNLYPYDTFNVITFAGETKILFPEPVPATVENVSKAKKFLSRHRSEGGTEMMKAIKAALDPSDSQQHVRITCFMTDGFVGNDMDIIAEVQKHPNARVFAMGFSDAPNRFLLDKMAEYGRGEVDYVSATGDTSDAAKRFNERVRNPLLTDITVDWSGLPVTDVYPKSIPDLFSVKPVILSGRYTQGGRGTIRLKGRTGGHDFAREIPVELPESEPAHDVLATLWARRRIDDLMGQDMSGMQARNMQPELKDEITRLGIDYRLMTQFTSFVAIDDVMFTGGEAPVRVDVPVEALPGSISSGLTEMVTVTGVNENMTLQQASDSVATVTARSLQELPLQGRNLERLLLLAPGTVAAGLNLNAASPPLNVSVNGQRATSNSFVVDGVDLNPSEVATGGTNDLVSPAAAQEVTIDTSSVEPHSARLPGAQVSVTTRSGTNAFHGSLFHFFGNSAVDANDWFANSRGLTRPPRRLNNFGGTFGGPINKNQTFFFASYEGLRLRQPVTAITDVPSANARQAAPAAVKPFLEAFPQANGQATTDGFSEFAATFANPARHDVAGIRLDHMLNSKTSIGARYNFADSDATARGADGLSLNTTNNISSRTQTITGWLTNTLSPTIVFDLRANYSRLRLTRSYLLDQFGGAVVPADFTAASDSSFTFDLNARGASLKTADDVSKVQRQLNFVASTQIVSGNHDFRFGAEYRRTTPVIASPAIEDSLLFNGMSQALTGVSTRANHLVQTTPQTPAFNNLSLYAQDNSKRTQRLTLNYGLRWELSPAPTNSAGERLWQTTYANFAPRFGFAYELSDATDAELILRGSVGVIYDTGQDRAVEAFSDSTPFISGTSVSDATVLPSAGSLPFVTFDPNLKLPYVLKWNVSIQRALGGSQNVYAAYVASAGRRLPGALTLFDQDPQFPFLRLVTNRANSSYRSLQLQFDRRFGKRVNALVSYTWARSMDNTNEDSARRVLMASLHPELDRGPSDFDVRHTLNGFVTYELPALFARGLGNRVFRNWIIDSLFNARSAKPVNVLYGFPTTYGFAYVRPSVLSGEPLYLFDATVSGGKRINPAAFTVPSVLEQGNLSRNSLRGFPFYQIDLALRRHFHFNENLGLQIQADAFNLLNHPNFADPAGNDLHLNATFGQSSSLAGRGFDSFYTFGGARVLRFSAKLIF